MCIHFIQFRPQAVKLSPILREGCERQDAYSPIAKRLEREKRSVADNARRVDGLEALGDLAAQIGAHRHRLAADKNGRAPKQALELRECLAQITLRLSGIEAGGWISQGRAPSIENAFIAGSRGDDAFHDLRQQLYVDHLSHRIVRAQFLYVACRNRTRGDEHAPVVADCVVTRCIEGADQ